VSSLIEEFLDAGCNVQLRHSEKETSWQDRKDHGYIAIFDQGKQLLRRDGFQHNANLRNGGAYDAKAVKAVVEETLALLKPKKLPSFIESEFTTKVEYEAWVRTQDIEIGLDSLSLAGAAA